MYLRCVQNLHCTWNIFCTTSRSLSQLVGEYSSKALTDHNRMYFLLFSFSKEAQKKTLEYIWQWTKTKKWIMYNFCFVFVRHNPRVSPFIRIQIDHQRCEPKNRFCTFTCLCFSPYKIHKNECFRTDGMTRLKKWCVCVFYGVWKKCGNLSCHYHHVNYSAKFVDVISYRKFDTLIFSLSSHVRLLLSPILARMTPSVLVSFQMTFYDDVH